VGDLDRDDDRRPLSAAAKAMALRIMQSAVVADLRSDAAELAELFAGLDEPTKRRLLNLLFRS
jgi:hypothetical protein